jgi:uncharacterized protein
VPRRIESLFLSGAAGRLAALLEEPEDGEAVEACLVCHPHPLFGGTMHNKVVYRLAKALRRTGSVVLRFNFRGVNLSEGVHDHGPGEMQDARAALEFLRGRYPELPFSLAGFSFGSRVALKLGCQTHEPRPERLIAVGFPTSRGKVEYLSKCSIPKYFVHSTVDEFGPKEELERFYEQFAGPKSLQFIEAGDHFFAGSLDKLEAVISALPR